MSLSFPEQPPYLVTPTWLSQHLDDPRLRILDARLHENYTEGHIPLSLHVDLKALRYTKDGVDGMLIEPEPFAAIASSLGIGDDTLVVIYDDYFSQVASRIAWSLLRYGHTKVALLDGGWDTWEAAGLPTTAEVKRPAHAHFRPHLVDSPLADLDYVRSHLNSPDVVLLDVRSPAEYSEGHIPNAVAWNWENGTSFEAAFRPLDELRGELAKLGVTPDKEIVTYCQSGMRASHTYFLLKQLGFEHVRMYDGSWAEWSLKEGNSIHAG
jgi:thiosulfate/3-mercaptopyruvate sulfurtransferase